MAKETLEQPEAAQYPCRDHLEVGLEGVELGKSGHLNHNLQQLLGQIEVPWCRLAGPRGHWAAGEPPR